MQKSFDNKGIWDTKGIMDELSQHDKFKIVVSSSHSQYALPKHQYEKFLVPHRGEAYFFMFYEKGVSEHRVDWQSISLLAGELLFILPNQIHASPPIEADMKFFTLSFPQSLCSALPQQLPFLINPFATPKITFNEAAKDRVINLFITLNKLLQDGDKGDNAAIVLAYLNSILTEFNTAYFKNVKSKSYDDQMIAKFIEFKLGVESDFKAQPSIKSMAAKLSVSETKLYKIVKHYSGFSPKEYLIKRLMLEAQRNLFYDKPSAKELAYDLGFNDPDYFSRLFKRRTGKSISQFLHYWMICPAKEMISPVL
jgi:AraC family transcriptional activator of pobA